MTRRPPGRRSTALILGLVVGAVALLALVGGLALVLGGRGNEQPVIRITPSPQTLPPDESSTSPRSRPTTRPKPSMHASPGPTAAGFRASNSVSGRT